MKQILVNHMAAIWPPEDAKAAQKIFTSTYSYLRQRLATLSSYCVVRASITQLMACICVEVCLRQY